MKTIIPNTELKKQIDDLKDLAECLPLNIDQKSGLYKMIHDGPYGTEPVSNLPLNAKQTEVLNKYIGEVRKTYASEMAEARSCPAVSEWMTEPVTEVNMIWDYLIEKRD